MNIKQLITPTPEVIMEMRSCLNCLHRTGTDPAFWRCAAAGVYGRRPQSDGKAALLVTCVGTTTETRIELVEAFIPCARASKVSLIA